MKFVVFVYKKINFEACNYKFFQILDKFETNLETYPVFANQNLTLQFKNSATIFCRYQSIENCKGIQKLSKLTK